MGRVPDLPLIDPRPRKPDDYSYDELRSVSIMKFQVDVKSQMKKTSGSHGGKSPAGV